jgi:hypothetical protein
MRSGTRSTTTTRRAYGPEAYDGACETVPRNGGISDIVLSMKPEQADLAKQIITYADAITAFSFVQSTAFGFALGRHEFRESMLKIPHHWIWGIPVAFFVYIGLVAMLWKGYRKALCASKEETDSDEYKLAWALWLGRIGVIILAGVLSAIAIGFTLHGAPAPGDTSYTSGPE